MDIKLRTSGILAELTIESNNTRIIEDIVVYESGGFRIDGSLIDSCIAVANEMSRFNGTNDLEFVINICNSILSENEIEDLIDELSK